LIKLKEQNRFIFPPFHFSQPVEPVLKAIKLKLTPSKIYNFLSTTEVDKEIVEVFFCLLEVIQDVLQTNY
jgi:hypothetical protein